MAPAFQKSQYHSVRKDAELAIRWAEAYGCDVYDVSHASASSYFTLIPKPEDEERVLSVRVSEHEPNYSLTNDRDYMLYIGGPYATRFGGLTRYAAWLGEITGQPMPGSVRRFFTYWANRQRREAERQAERDRREAADIAEAKRDFNALLKAMSPAERERWDAWSDELNAAHGKRRKRLGEKQSKLLRRVKERARLTRAACIGTLTSSCRIL